MSFTIKAADLFCGAGGASTGLVRAAQACGFNVDLLAVNHWPTAVETHSLNHPGVRHLCEAVDKINPREAVPGGRLHLLLAGPECTHHSTARGGRPINDQSRTSAWHILKWAQELYIDTILIENVPEFRQWGPLGANGRPMKSKKGQTYRAFLDALRSLGYRVEDREVCCADYGDPTTRRRLFVLAQRGQKRVAFPSPSHSRTGGRTLFGKTAKWRAAREIIDWQLEGQSIFHRKKPLAPATMARIVAGLEKFGTPQLQPFIVVLRNHMAGRSVDAPLPTLSAQGQHVGLCEPFLVANNANNAPHSTDDPLGAVTGGNRHYVVEPFLVDAAHGNDAKSGSPASRTKSLDDPIGTVTGSNRFAVVQPYVLGQQTGSVARSTEQPLPTVSTDGAIALIEPFLVPMYGERPTQEPRTHSVDEPVPTIPASGGGKFGVVEPFILQTSHGQRVHDIENPLPTVTTARGGDFAVVEPYIVQTAERRRESVDSVDDPLRTVTAMGGRCFGLAEPFITKYNGTAKTAQSVADPLDTISTRDRFGLVQPVIDGYVLDIRFRMLQPHELAAATSFPKEYQFCGKKEDVVKQIGNAWPGETAKALCQEIIQPYASRTKRSPRKARVA